MQTFGISDHDKQTAWMLQYTEDNNLINHALCQYMFVFVTRMDFSYKKKKKK